GRVMCNREKDLQDLAIGYLPRVERHLHALGVAGAARADGLILRIFLRATRIARHGVADAFDMLIDGLDAPKASPPKHGSLEASVRRRGFGGWGRNRYCGFGVRGKWGEGDGSGEQEGGRAHHRVSQRSFRPHIRTKPLGGITRSYTCA